MNREYRGRPTDQPHVNTRKEGELSPEQKELLQAHKSLEAAVASGDQTAADNYRKKIEKLAGTELPPGARIVPRSAGGQFRVVGGG